MSKLSGTQLCEKCSRFFEYTRLSGFVSVCVYMSVFTSSKTTKTRCICVVVVVVVNVVVPKVFRTYLFVCFITPLHVAFI